MPTRVLARGTAPRDARRAVSAQCKDAVTGAQCADAPALLTSEVVTNALRYSTGDIRFRVAADAVRVRVEVGDDERAVPSAPEVGHQADDAEGGRGLQILAALASGWGVLPTVFGKLVWFEVPAQP